MDHNGGKPAGVAEGGAGGGSTGGYSSKGQGEGAMKAPGAEGYISREAFERNPQGYFQGLHHGDKGSTGDYSSKGQGEASSSVKPNGGDGAMKAPGAKGYISREAFERNPQGYFQGLHHGDKGAGK